MAFNWDQEGERSGAVIVTILLRFKYMEKTINAVSSTLLVSILQLPTFMLSQMVN